MPEHGIHTIDTGYVRPGFDAAYLVVEAGRGAFIDCGTNHSVPVLLAALAQAGLAPADVDWLVLTHVHLDHAGGASTLMRHLPNARLVAHPRAAPHMVDPARLVAGATAVYGEAEFARHYGELVPVPSGRVATTVAVLAAPSSKPAKRSAISAARTPSIIRAGPSNARARISPSMTSTA